MPNSGITEDMIVCNMVEEIIKDFRDDVLTFTRDYYLKYDPCKSISKKGVVEILKTLVCGLEKLKGDFYR